LSEDTFYFRGAISIHFLSDTLCIDKDVLGEGFGVKVSEAFGNGKLGKVCLHGRTVEEQALME
jgi:hypothetical protein